MLFWSMGMSRLPSAICGRFFQTLGLLNVLVGISRLLGELDGRLLELGAVNLAVCHGALLLVVWTFLSATHYR